MKRFRRIHNYWPSVLRKTTLSNGRGKDARFVLFDIRYYAGERMEMFSVCILNIDFTFTKYHVTPEEVRNHFG